MSDGRNTGGRNAAALARAVRLAAEGGVPFEELLSRSPVLERQLLEITFARLERERAAARRRAQRRPSVAGVSVRAPASDVPGPRGED